MDTEDLSARLLKGLEEKERELQAKLADLDLEYWPRIEHAFNVVKITTCNITAQRAGERLGEYRGKKAQLEDTLHYIKHVLRPYIQHTCAQAATDADDGFDQDDMGFVLPVDDAPAKS
ncbi:hypothetical protein HY490_04375 [Candidatus Woesearchaeota archaeon]|nr:hypothetical protein [Candidatus Woesearchaeota archaeon]